MRRGSQSYPTITPARALRLLCDLERAGDIPNRSTLADVKAALRDHVLNALARKRRR